MCDAWMVCWWMSKTEDEGEGDGEDELEAIVSVCLGVVVSVQLRLCYFIQIPVLIIEKHEEVEENNCNVPRLVII